MIFNKNLKNVLLVIFATLILSACSTAKKSGDIDGDVYTGTETVKYLASGVPDRVFFATNKSSLTTASRATLRKQATYLRKNKNLNVTIEGHADERGTREYNLALGEKDQGCKMISGLKKEYPKASKSVLQKAQYEQKKFKCKY